MMYYKLPNTQVFKINLVILLLLISTITSASTHVVTASVDGAFGSLRDVIQNTANDGDTIYFSSDLDGFRIFLDTTLDVSIDLVIIGNDTTNTIIDGNRSQTYRLFTISGDAEVEFQHMTFQNGGGNTGVSGAVMKLTGSSKVSLQNCLIKNNEAGASGNDGGFISMEDFSKCEAIDCIFRNNTADDDGGVAFYDSFSKFEAKNCLFEYNQAGSGGGVAYHFNLTKFKLTNCIVRNNTSNGSGGVVRLWDNSNFEAIQTLFHDNHSAVGGGTSIASASQNATLDIKNCTVSQNTSSNGGNHSVFFGQYIATLSNNIIYDNNGGEALTCSSCINNSSFNNLIDVKGDINSGNGNIFVDPAFRNVVINNFRLLPTSPGIDAGNDALIPSEITTDLDGNPRIRFGTVDIGAYEGFSCSSVDTLYVNVNNTSPGDGSSWTQAIADLQEAIDISNVCEGGKEIWVAEGIYRPMHDNPASDDNGPRDKTFYIDHQVKIYGGFSSGDTSISQSDSLLGSTLLTGDLGNQDTAYHVIVMKADNINSDWRIDGVSISDGKADGGIGNDVGGGIYVEALTASPYLTNCQFFNNKASNQGGAIYAVAEQETSPKLTNCDISYNTAIGDGGGIYLEANPGGETSPKLTNCDISYNTAIGDGGGIYVKASTASPQLTNCFFNYNTAIGDGGGIYLKANPVGETSPQLTNCFFDNNTANEYGGGFYVEANSGGETSPQLTNCFFFNNSANLDGGGLYVKSLTAANPQLTNCGFFDNMANSGGGIYVDAQQETNPQLINCSFSNNTASQGGGISVFAVQETNPQLTNCSFTYNSAVQGGGIYNFAKEVSPQLTNCSFANNTADIDGGGILANGYVMVSAQLINTILWNNKADNDMDDLGSGDDLYLSRSDNSKISYSIVTAGGIHIADPNNRSIDTMTVFLDDDPLFEDAVNDNLRLKPGSLAINEGINDSIPPGIITDLDGNPRIRYGTVDMGAYEGVPCISADTLYVDVSHNAPGDGSSWNAAITDLQEAINISNACEGGKEIWVTKGTYRPTQLHDVNLNLILEEREKTFYLSHQVQIYGGFTNGQAMRSERDSLGGGGILIDSVVGGTILTADLDNGQDFAYHVMVMDADNITHDWRIDGVVIKDGRADGLAYNEVGGGIFAIGTNASPQLTNCSFTNNTAIGQGGGVCAFGGGIASPLLTNCILDNNQANYEGGGLYVSGSTAASPELMNCSFTNNKVNDENAAGGGIFALSDSDANPQLTNCRFINNTATEEGGVGGGIFTQASSSSPQLSNCIFINNAAYSGGGWIYAFGDALASPQLTNCSFTNNSATFGGGIIIYSTTKANPQLTNTILWNNSTVTGKDLWLSRSDNSKISNSIVTAGGIHIADPNNRSIDTTSVFLHDDPVFVDAMSDDLRLDIGSPAIDRGENYSTNFADITTDLDGNPRIYNHIVDMGAFEVSACTNTALTISPPNNFGAEALTVVTDNKITADNVINVDKLIQYHGAAGVILQADFKVMPGASFRAMPIGCAQL